MSQCFTQLPYSFHFRGCWPWFFFRGEVFAAVAESPACRLFCCSLGNEAQHRAIAHYRSCASCGIHWRSFFRRQCCQGSVKNPPS